MKIRKLQLKNIGVFDDETIEFQECPEGKAEIHIFTGENGTGKTTILMALADFFYPTPVAYKRNIHKRIRQDEVSYDNYFAKLSFDDGENVSRGKEQISITGFDHITFDGDGNDEFVDYINRGILYQNKNTLTFAVFAFSGYRQIESESVQASYLPKNFNPLSQSLEFIKDYGKEGEITINQLIANNISNYALSKLDGSFEEAKKYEAVINAIETFIKNITDYETKFVLKRSPNELKLKMHGEELDFDVLPDGLRSLISWIADLLGRVDLLKWNDDLPITEKNLILFLDEIEVHLHPAWQRKVLPVVQKLFKNAQIFVSTHSPFVVNSVDDAWVYKLELENGKAKVGEIFKSEDAWSYSRVLSEIFDIDEEFGIGVQKDLAKFKELRNELIKSKNGSRKTQKEFLKLAKSLAVQSEELQTIVQFELRQLNKRIGKNLAI